jgi:hypothetical protein
MKIETAREAKKHFGSKLNDAIAKLDCTEFQRQAVKKIFDFEDCAILNKEEQESLKGLRLKVGDGSAHEMFLICRFPPFKCIIPD